MSGETMWDLPVALPENGDLVKLLFDLRRGIAYERCPVCGETELKINRHLTFAYDSIGITCLGCKFRVFCPVDEEAT